MLVDTIKGPLERNLLTVKDIIDENDNARVLATEWYLGDELVRRDAMINLLRGISTELQTGTMG